MLAHFLHLEAWALLVYLHMWRFVLASETSLWGMFLRWHATLMACGAQPGFAMHPWAVASCFLIWNSWSVFVQPACGCHRSASSTWSICSPQSSSSKPCVSLLIGSVPLHSSRVRHRLRSWYLAALRITARPVKREDEQLVATFSWMLAQRQMMARIAACWARRRSHPAGCLFALLASRSQPGRSRILAQEAGLGLIVTWTPSTTQL
mmetsp:Transcript_147954/g.384596  ORF Transcript_147954/g.384596 Transcript_147954/m.384596 type:complete len:207 (+) Transcript_147954:117-737(+)